MNLNQVTLPAKDIEKSKDFYRRMGFTQIVDDVHYARFECPEGASTFSLHAVDEPFQGGPVVYFEHRELDALVEKLIKDGFEFERMPADMSWLWREAELRDPSGNTIILYWAGENRLNPPWRL